MTDVRTIPASARLHPATVEQRVTLPDPELARHAADAIAKHSRRGWRIDKPTKRAHIDGLIALVMAIDRVENRPAPVQVLSAHHVFLRSENGADTSENLVALCVSCHERIEAELRRS